MYVAGSADSFLEYQSKVPGSRVLAATTLRRCVGIDNLAVSSGLRKLAVGTFLCCGWPACRWWCYASAGACRYTCPFDVLQNMLGPPGILEDAMHLGSSFLDSLKSWTAL